MSYVIYSPASKAEVRHEQITEDAIEANFLDENSVYESVIYHPTEDKAALLILITEGFYYNDMPVKSLDFGIFFTSQERAKAVDNLPSDWFDDDDLILE